MIHIKRTDEIGKSDNVMYRYNYSGNNITDPVKVIAFEIGELGNTDIPDYCLENYGDKMRPNVYNEIENAIELIEDCDMDEEMAEQIAKRIVSEMERILKVYDRTFKCDCGVEMDRDVHAAMNMVWFYENNVGVGLTEVKRVEMREKILDAVRHSNQSASLNHEADTL